MKRFSLVGLALLAMAVTPVLAQDAIRKEQVQFKKGADSATIKGSIKGDETIDYVLSAKAGQSMVVNLKASNSSAYFNVLPPGSDEAIFIGSSAGSRFEGNLPADGEYTVRVYLMRNAARRNETAKYTLTVKVAAGR